MIQQSHIMGPQGSPFTPGKQVWDKAEGSHWVIYPLQPYHLPNQTLIGPCQCDQGSNHPQGVSNG